MIDFAAPTAPPADVQPADLAESRESGRRNPVPERAWPRQPRTDAPIPAVGDLWGLSNPDPLPSAAAARSRVIPTPYRATRQVAAPASSLALTLALLSLPLVLVGGVGAITGFASIVSAAAGIRQIRKQPLRYKGNGRSVAAIIIGTGCALCGTPVLLLVMLIAAL